ncbi:hypothetical protein [Salisediminibacterium halotolerans]|uniref:Uncharacterized protein n=1 Tax=Salisediminibacterium halotolerans TaxID=517425 RepID=A0A1H9WQ92_9BACI|nr:hypothetical protein [Salisediminibacterium haloalkalitolerans]SES35994.1 hypothetical protein SAMN05444126_14213 [Salisediminibacterium haloalkalitolerans]
MKCKDYLLVIPENTLVCSFDKKSIVCGNKEANEFDQMPLTTLVWYAETEKTMKINEGGER